MSPLTSTVSGTGLGLGLAGVGVEVAAAQLAGNRVAAHTIAHQLIRLMAPRYLPLTQNACYETLVLDMARSVRDPSAPERIVEDGWRVVAAQGVRGATMRSIAAEAGVSTGFITHYFEDKRELIVEVLRHNNARAAERVLAAAGRKRGLAA